MTMIKNNDYMNSVNIKYRWSILSNVLCDINKEKRMTHRYHTDTKNKNIKKK